MSIAQSMVVNAVQRNPFPGLRPFKESESHLFFGREKQIDELLNILQNTRLLAVVGASGSGKSSLVKCGLIPGLHSGFITEAGAHWNISLFTPGDNPFGNMARGLVEDVLNPDATDADKQFHTSVVEATLRRSSKGLIELYKEYPAFKETNLLVVIDQFEEIFRFRKKEIEEDAPQQDTVSFINLLLETAKLKEAPIYVVFTMRSDFLGDCTLFRGLPEAINDGQYLIPRMTREERKTAVLGPMAVGGASATDALITRLLNDVGNNPDQLPILQHALMRTWEYWNAYENPSIALDIKHYEAVGTLESALSRHAEEAFSELKTERQRAICEAMFKALTEKGTDNKGTRRPLSLAAIAGLTNASTKEIKEIVEVFRNTGRSFLMPPVPTPLEDDTIIDISHESLMRTWERLMKWVDEEQQSSETYLRLAEAAALYQQSKSGLWRNPELQIALRWQERNQPNEAWAKRYNPSFERAISFLEYSQKQHEFEIEEKERRQLARLKRTRLIAIVVGIAAIFALILATYAIFQRAEAVRQKAEAVKQQGIAEENEKEAVKQTKLADEARLVAEANEKEAVKQKNIADEQRGIAIQQKIEAQRQKEEAQKQRAIAEQERQRAEELQKKAEDNEKIALENEAEAVKQKKVADEQRGIAVEQKNIAETNEKEANRLRNLAVSRNQSLEAVQLISDGLTKEGTEMALGAYNTNKENNGPHHNDANYQALSQALNSTQPSAYLYQDKSSVKAVAVKPVSNELLIANEEGVITVLKQSKTNLQPQYRVRLGYDQILDAGYSKDKKHLYAASYEGNLGIWDAKTLEDKAKPSIKKAYNTPVLNVSPISDNTILVQTGDKVYIEEIKGEELSRRSSKNYTNIKDAIVTDDGTNVLIAKGKNIYVHTLDNSMDLGDGQSIALNKRITKVAISKDKKYLAAGLEDGQIAIIQLNGSMQPTRTDYESMHQTMVSGLAFYQHDDFLQLASASFDNTAKLTDITNLNSTSPQQDKITLKGHTKWIYDLKYSNSGKYIYTVNEDKTIRVWYAKSGDMVNDLKSLGY